MLKNLARPSSVRRSTTYFTILLVIVLAGGWWGDHRSCERTAFVAQALNGEARQDLAAATRADARAAIDTGAARMLDLKAAAQDRTYARRLAIGPLDCSGPLPSVP